jgi:hypothetical protein
LIAAALVLGDVLCEDDELDDDVEVLAEAEPEWLVGNSLT